MCAHARSHMRVVILNPSPYVTACTRTRTRTQKDYGGFPEESYEYTYGAAGSPNVADQVLAALAAEGVEHGTKNTDRGWDHGVFVPLMLAFPKAEVPVVQLSLVSGLDPLLHLKMGKALGRLRTKNILILGSGMCKLRFSLS